VIPYPWYGNNPEAFDGSRRSLEPFRSAKLELSFFWGGNFSYHKSGPEPSHIVIIISLSSAKQIFLTGRHLYLYCLVWKSRWKRWVLVFQSLLSVYKLRRYDQSGKKYCTVAAYIYYCTVRYSIMARIKLCKNPPRRCIKAPIVLSFTRLRWSSTTFSPDLALLVCGSNLLPLHDFAAYFLLSTVPVPTINTFSTGISRNSSDTLINVEFCESRFTESGSRYWLFT
jgi:hypothetical protein